MPNTEAITQIICKTIGLTRRKIEPASITADTKIADIGADEYDKLGIAMAIEDELRVSVSEHAMAEARTVGDLVDAVEAGRVAG
ncbi:acyl carrier protein [Novosphingobium capsulatum]|uniref:Acyl carrier protein n=1 Tax=Novosphingobium capsulatum TaxID=13688 RepID=A0ABU1MNC0_9SPHN|nr:phosphopantetheine-binding protein [Novosphingobium capsulatum]MDR6511521.1 acyl carrier protein [Novosphingobium capsulatum]